MKIPRRKGKKHDRLPVEVDLTQDISSEDDDITIEAVKSVTSSSGSSSSNSRSTVGTIASETTEDCEVVAAQIVAEPNPGFFQAGVDNIDERAGGGGGGGGSLADVVSGRSLRVNYPSVDPMLSQQSGLAGEASQAGSQDYRPRRLRHPWPYSLSNGCYRDPFHGAHARGGCPCSGPHSHQHDVSDGGIYEIPPPAHRSSHYPSSMPETAASAPGGGSSSGRLGNRLIRAVQRMNPRHQRLWHMQTSQQEQLRRHMLPSSSRQPSASGVDDIADLGEPQGQQQDPLQDGQAQPGPTSLIHNRPPIPFPAPRLSGSGRPTASGQHLPNPPPAHLQSQPHHLANPPPAHLQSQPHQQRLPDDMARYRPYQHSWHRWHTPVLPEPPGVNFLPPRFDDMQHPLPHYPNPWSSNLRAHRGLADHELGVMIPRPLDYPRALDNYGPLLTPRNMFNMEVG